MNRFNIEAGMDWFTDPTTKTRQRGTFLRQTIHAFYHADYSGGGNWNIQGTIENLIVTLKNDITPYAPTVLQACVERLANILSADLPLIAQYTDVKNFTICVIPRAKIQYKPNQLLFRATVSHMSNKLNGFDNGTDYIIRHTDTKTTHLSRGSSAGGNGNAPYPGITKETCTISDQVRGKDILLIDDLYTKSVNIDEDGIQALIDSGANSVTFYSVGKTVLRT